MQLVQPSGPDNGTPPITITLQDAWNVRVKMIRNILRPSAMRKVPTRTGRRPEMRCCLRLQKPPNI